jgi:glucose-specific phosphotransferase system IIA component
MKAALDKKRTVLYCGGNAHALVVDGYTSKDYYHFNYGWGGFCDGYFKYALCHLYESNAYVISGIRHYDPAIKVIGDLKYEVIKETGTADIVDCMKTGAAGDVLDIPATVTDEEGITYKVNNIRQMAFYRKGHFDKVTVGENLESVDPFSFMYTTIDELVLNDKLKEVPDEAFASGAMGWCCGIAPDADVITSAFTGDIMQVADTYHALGVDGDNGVQVVIHVGMDTAELHGDGFQCHVRGGQPVQLGERLLDVDFEKIRTAGHSDVVVMAVLNSDDYQEAELILEALGKELSGGKD